MEHEDEVVPANDKGIEAFIPFNLTYVRMYINNIVVLGIATHRELNYK